MTNVSQCLADSTDPGLSGVVSASAGTGKTWLLIARLLRLLLADVPPDSILAITFTNKATHEMYERLTRRVRDWVDMDETDLRRELAEIGASPELSGRARTLFDILLKNEPLRITTFHSFCVDIVRLFPFDAEIPLGFTINDESDAGRLYDEAIQRLHEEALHDGALLRALNGLTGSLDLNNTRDALYEFLDHRNDWRALTIKQGRGVNDVKRALARDLEIDPDQPPSDVLDAGMREAIEEWRELLLRQDEIIRKDEKHIEQAGDLLDTPNDRSLSLDECIRYRKLFVTEGGRVQRLSSNKSFVRRLSGRVNIAHRVEALEERISSRFDRYISSLSDHHNWSLNAAWYECGEYLVKLYQALQREQKSLDFNDLEWHACRLFNSSDDAQAVQSRLGARIRHVLIDEFQDTSPEQWLLIKPLLDEIASQKENGSVFIVGDVKQSIYGFRRANPDLLGEARDWVGERMNGYHHELNDSHRSSGAVIDLVNRAFADPEKEGMRLTGFSPHGTHRSDVPGTIGILPLGKGADRAPTSADDAWLSPLRRSTAFPVDAHDREAEQVAAHMVSIKAERGLEWGDFMVLMRRRTHVLQYEAAFRKHGIPVIGGQGDALARTMEAGDILALLRFIVSPRRLLSLNQILRSPLFSASDEDLRRLRRAPGKTPSDKLRALAEEDPEGTWAEAHRTLKGWIEQSGQLPPHDLLHLIYRQRDVVRRYRLAARADDRDLVEARLLHLLHLSLDFQSGRYPHTAGFIEHLETLSDKYKVVVEPSAKADHVRLLTIHGAKGLEAEVVFVVDCGAQRRHMRTYSALVDWPGNSGHPSCMLLLPRQKHLGNYCREKIETQEEHQRIERANLLYVALTRARDSLFISGSTAGGDHENWHEWLGGHLADIDVVDRDTPSEPGERTETEAETVIRPLIMTTPELESEINPGKAKGRVPGRKAERGRAIHRALQLLSEGADPEEIGNRLRREISADDDAMEQWLNKALSVFRHDALRDVFNDDLYQRVFNEMPVWFTHDQHMVVGRIDRVCVDRKRVWVIDYKTHADEEQAKRESVDQMRLYREGVSRVWPRHAVRTSILLTGSATLHDC